ncbi:MAG TPA: hypothetical protein VHG28_10120 [Longimicrobiaceae bacterium]|nr:hypothetical protein [Longimicrobiaceae bacterium]
MKNLRILVGVLALGLGACGETTLLSPDSPSYDGGPTIGTGHRSDSGNTTTSSTSTETTSDGTSTERGGSTFGTGH